jgi:hypothetical protein
MKYSLIIFIFVTPLIAYNQEWKLTNYVGYAKGKTNTFRKIMLATEISAEYEHPIGVNLYLGLGVSASTLTFNYYDRMNLSVYNGKYFLGLPVSIKKYYYLSRTSKGFVDFGFYGNYLFYDKKEFQNSFKEETVSRNWTGYNIGISGSIGFKTKITNSLFFDVSLSGKLDYFNHYKNDVDKLKTNQRLLGISFYKKFR